jgi:hypothetical protein
VPPVTERRKALSLNIGGFNMNQDRNYQAITEIAQLNDEYRQGTHFLVTPGVQALEDFLGLVQAVREYADFDEDNDPYGEHDFGSLEWAVDKVFWKIDYYDKLLEGWCDPLSPDCKRVLTVMLAEEY